MEKESLTSNCLFRSLYSVHEGMMSRAPNAYSFLKSPAACSMRIDGAYAVEPPASFPEAPLLVPERIADSEVIQLDGKSLYSRSALLARNGVRVRFLQHLLQDCEIARIPGLRDQVVLVAYLAEYGIMDVHEIREAEFLLWQYGGDQLIVLQNVDRG